MRIIRTVIAGLLAALLGLSAFAAAPVQADQAQSARALPKRTITEVPPDKEQQVDFNAFKLNGVVTELQADGVTYLPYIGKVQLQKKACAKGCNWRTVKKVKTDETGKYRTKIFVPLKGVWKWRVKVKASNGFGTTKGNVWTAAFE
jgi:hypothetical protein